MRVERCRFIEGNPTPHRIAVVHTSVIGHEPPLVMDSTRASGLAVVASMGTPGREAIRETFATVVFHVVTDRSKASMSARG